MKPIEIKNAILSLQKRAVASLTDLEKYQINGGLATKPTVETLVGCPCTHFCEPQTTL